MQPVETVLDRADPKIRCTTSFGLRAAIAHPNRSSVSLHAERIETVLLSLLGPFGMVDLGCFGLRYCHDGVSITAGLP